MKKTEIRMVRNPRKGRSNIMTDGQIRFQTVMENQRHNLAMEKIGQQEVSISNRQTKIKEAEEARNVALFPQQKVLVNAQAQEKISNTWFNAARIVDTGIKAARNLFGLFGDAMNFASSVEGASAGGYYQGSLFA